MKTAFICPFQAGICSYTAPKKFFSVTSMPNRILRLSIILVHRADWIQRRQGSDPSLSMTPQWKGGAHPGGDRCDLSPGIAHHPSSE